MLQNVDSKCFIRVSAQHTRNTPRKGRRGCAKALVWVEEAQDSSWLADTAPQQGSNGLGCAAAAPTPKELTSQQTAAAEAAAAEKAARAAKYAEGVLRCGCDAAKAKAWTRPEHLVRGLVERYLDAASDHISSCPAATRISLEALVGGLARTAVTNPKMWPLVTLATRLLTFVCHQADRLPVAAKLQKLLDSSEIAMDLPALSVVHHAVMQMLQPSLGSSGAFGQHGLLLQFIQYCVAADGHDPYKAVKEESQPEPIDLEAACSIQHSTMQVLAWAVVFNSVISPRSKPPGRPTLAAFEHLKELGVGLAGEAQVSTGKRPAPTEANGGTAKKARMGTNGDV